MRTTFILLTTTALLLAGAVFSGEMGDMSHGKETGKAKMSEKSPMHQGMMKDMDQHMDKMMSQVSQMREHMNKMQNLDNMSGLQAELDKHENLMNKLHEQMKAHQNMTDSAMSMYGMMSGEER